MTVAPIAQTVHDGSGSPPEWRRQLIADWLAVHGVRAKDVSADHPILVLNLPYQDSAQAAAHDEPWIIQVISFVRYIRNDDDRVAAHPTTGRPLTVQCTTPLKTPFPADPTTADEGTADGQEPQVEAVEEGQCPPEHEGTAGNS